MVKYSLLIRLKCQEFSIQSMTGGVKRCFESRKIPEHAQEPPESQTRSSIPPVCNWRFLTGIKMKLKEIFKKNLEVMKNLGE